MPHIQVTKNAAGAEGVKTSNIENGAVTEAKLAAALQTGAWTALESVNAKLEERVGSYTCRVRTESLGANARLRGAFAAKAAEELKANEAAFTVPLAFRPAKEIIAGTVQMGSTAMQLKIATTGVVTLSVAITAGNGFWLDGITWSIT